MLSDATNPQSAEASPSETNDSASAGTARSDSTNGKF